MTARPVRVRGVGQNDVRVTGGEVPHLGLEPLDARGELGILVCEVVGRVAHGLSLSLSPDV